MQTNLARQLNPSSTQKTNTKHHQKLAYNDFFIGVNDHDITSPEFIALKDKVKLTYLYLNKYRQDGDRFKKRYHHQGRNFDLPDGTLWANGSLIKELVKYVGVKEKQVRAYLRELCDAGFLQHDPNWKRVGGQIRYLITRFQDQKVTTAYLNAIHKLPVQAEPADQKTLDISEQVHQMVTDTTISLLLDSKSNSNSSSSLENQNQQPSLLTSEAESTDPIKIYPHVSNAWKEKTKKVPPPLKISYTIDSLTRVGLSELQAEKVLISAIPNFNFHHPDGGLVHHITWIAEDTRAYDGTTGDWLTKAIEAEGGQIPKAKAKAKPTSQAQNHQAEEWNGRKASLERTQKKIKADQDRIAEWKKEYKGLPQWK